MKKKGQGKLKNKKVGRVGKALGRQKAGGRQSLG
jgi:hypothetical protein